MHSIKFKSVAAPNGLIANLYVPVEGKRHDSAMLPVSGLLPLLQQHSNTLNGHALCIHGNPACALRQHLQCPFRGNVTPIHHEYNKATSQV